MFKVSEVCEKQIRTTKERPDGTSYTNFEKVLDTRDCLLNAKYIVSIHSREFSSAAELRMIEGRFPEGTKFSTFVVDGNSFRSSEITVVGSFDKFCRMLQENQP